jgi:hypothetical protein
VVVCVCVCVTPNPEPPTPKPETLQPVNYLTHLKLADVLYSLDDMPLARKYYAQSLELNRDNNPRAALGMVLCTSGTGSHAPTAPLPLSSAPPPPRPQTPTRNPQPQRQTPREQHCTSTSASAALPCNINGGAKRTSHPSRQLTTTEHAIQEDG